MQSIKKIKKERFSLRTAITKFISKFETLINDENKETDDYSEILEQLNDRGESLKNFIREIEATTTIVRDYENDFNTRED